MDLFKNLIIKAAKEAGDTTIKIFESTNYKIDYKKDNSPITIADIESNNIIIKNLSEIGIPIISEELDVNIENLPENTYWLIDPIDGTKQFIKSEKEFTINIALIKNSFVHEAVVYAPALNFLYYGNIFGDNIKIDTANNSSMPISQKDETSKKINIILSKSHLNQETINLIKKIKDNLPEINIMRIGSSLKFCYLAEGIADLYIRTGEINTWDIAAGHTIVKSVGGNVLDLNTFEEIRYQSQNHVVGNFIAYKDITVLEKIKPIINYK